MSGNQNKILKGAIWGWHIPKSLGQNYGQREFKKVSQWDGLYGTTTGGELFIPWRLEAVDRSCLATPSRLFVSLKNRKKNTFPVFVGGWKAIEERLALQEQSVIAMESSKQESVSRNETQAEVYNMFLLRVRERVRFSLQTANNLGYTVLIKNKQRTVRKGTLGGIVACFPFCCLSP